MSGSSGYATKVDFDMLRNYTYELRVECINIQNERHDPFLGQEFSYV